MNKRAIIVLIAISVICAMLSALCSCGDEPKVISCYSSPYNSKFFLGGYDFYYSGSGIECENTETVEPLSGHFPIHKIESAEELEDFRVNTLLARVPQSTTPELTEHLKSYTEEFFADKILLAVGTYAGGDSYSFYVSSFEKDGKSVKVGLSKKLIAPGISVYSGSSYGLVTLEVDRAELEGVKSYDAVEETEHLYYDVSGGLNMPTLALDVKSKDGCLVYYSNSERAEHYGVFESNGSQLVLYSTVNGYKIVFDINKNGSYKFNSRKTSNELGIEIKNGTLFEPWQGAPQSAQTHKGKGYTLEDYKISFFDGYSSMRYPEDADVIPCENIKEIVGDSRGHLPVYLINSEEYLDGFIKVMLPDYEHISNDCREAVQYLGGFDETYFDQKLIFIISLSSGSGSYTYYVTDLKNENGCLSVCISRTLMPLDIAVTADMKYWVIVIEADKSVLEGVTKIDAVWDTEHKFFETDTSDSGYLRPQLAIDRNSHEYFFDFCVPYKNPQKSKYTSLVYTAQSVTLYGKYEETDGMLTLLPSEEHGNKIVFDVIGEKLVYSREKSAPAYELYLEDGTVFNPVGVQP